MGNRSHRQGRWEKIPLEGEEARPREPVQLPFLTASQPEAKRVLHVEQPRVHAQEKPTPRDMPLGGMFFSSRLVGSHAGYDPVSQHPLSLVNTTWHGGHDLTPWPLLLAALGQATQSLQLERGHSTTYSRVVVRTDSGEEDLAPLALQHQALLAATGQGRVTCVG